MPTDIITATGTWIAPANAVSPATVVCRGAGGGGAGPGIVGGVTGGGGGATVTASFAFTPGSSYTATVGAGGAGGTVDGTGEDGEATWFDDASTIYADFGRGGGGNFVPGGDGSGGLAASCIGDSAFDGGDAAEGFDFSGGGGGGGGGTSANGGDASGTTGGTGGTTGGGAGGDGGTGAGIAGSAGTAPGGGGGGGGDGANGGDGADGRIEVTYDLHTFAPATDKEIGIVPGIPEGFEYRNWQALIRNLRDINANLVQFNSAQGTTATFTVVTDVRMNAGGCIEKKTRTITVFSTASESGWTAAGCP